MALLQSVALPLEAIAGYLKTEKLWQLLFICPRRPMALLQSVALPLVHRPATFVKQLQDISKQKNVAVAFYLSSAHGSAWF